MQEVLDIFTFVPVEKVFLHRHLPQNKRDAPWVRKIWRAVRGGPPVINSKIFSFSHHLHKIILTTESLPDVRTS